MKEAPAQDFCGEAIASHFGQCDTSQSTSLVHAEEPWPQMDGAAYHGLAGDVVRTIAPHTESDRNAILIQLLAYFGNAAGNSAYYRVEADQHHANLFAVLVGRSAKARKGTSAGHVRSVMKRADQKWLDERMK